MGIKGLTSFIGRHQEYCMTEYELSNTPVVIDGNAIICYLYNNRFTDRNDSFGGDYDRFGQVIFEFFNLLASCRITPYLVFDGGYSSAKIPEIMRRMYQRVESIKNLENMNNLKTVQTYPLHMWGTFVSIVKKLNIKMIRCTFDCDLECANIGRALNCPVLSNDSDFYLCDILYVPLSTLKLDIHQRGSTNYISCKIYRVDCFLNYFKGLDKTKLPLLAVLLGNDNSNKDDAWYLSSIVRQDDSGRSGDKIKMTISWLQKYNTDCAIEKLTSQVDVARANRIQNTIHRAYKTYTCCDSKYLKYLGITVSNANVKDTSMQKYCEDIVGDDMDKNPNRISEYFLENLKNGLYPSMMMDIVSQNTFFCYPQVDDLEMVGAYKSSLDIIRAIHKILNKDHNHLTYFGRAYGTRYEKFQVPLIEKEFPYIDEIEHMDARSRQKIIAAALDFDDLTFSRIINHFPESWHIFILALKYSKVKTRVSTDLVIAFILCKIILGEIDGKIGFYRSRTALHSKYPQVDKTSETVVRDNLRESLSKIPLDNCLYCIDTLMHFFKLPPNDLQRNARLNRSLIRKISEIQACLLHLIYLNKLLETPLETPLLSECLNCTFVYQLATYLSKATDLYGTLRSLMKNSPVIHEIVIMIVKQVNGVSDHQLHQSK